MAIEQRVMVSPQREYETHDLPKQQPKIRRTKKIFSTGEKFLFVLFTAVLVLFASMILHTESQINDVNREVQALSGKIEETTKQNTELSIQVKEQSTYERVWEKARELGLNLNEKNVKVVPGR
jgi:cell division protein FtsL